LKANKLIIFDCDGVLVDSEHLANQALVDCLANIRISMSLEDALRNFKGRKLADCLAEIEKTNNCVLPESFEATFRQKMGEYFEAKLQPINGIAKALQSLSYSKCAASNGPVQKTKRNLEIAGLIHYFGDHIFSAYTIQKWKPEPDLFLHACKEMGSQPAHSVVVEDSELGIEAALAGGFKVLAFGVHTIQHRDVTSFQHMSELPKLIQEILSAN
jgi:HAD superfamily hydrolase (TIGR01509 family)